MDESLLNALSEPLDPALVSRRQGRGNRQFDYIEAHTVIDQANKIFGYGGWGYELVGDVSLRRIEKVDVSTGEVKVNYAYSAPVRVSVVGAPPRTDIGFHVVTEDTPEGHETAAKGAVTDGLKRAMRSFGDRFGNGLYGGSPPPGRQAGGQPRSTAQAPSPPPAPVGPETLAEWRLALDADAPQLVEALVHELAREPQPIRAAFHHLAKNMGWQWDAQASAYARR